MQMTDQQVMTIALSVVIPVSMLILSNSRINDAKETLRAEMQALRADLQKLVSELGSKIDALTVEVKRSNENTENATKQHVLEYHK